LSFPSNLPGCDRVATGDVIDYFVDRPATARSRPNSHCSTRKMFEASSVLRNRPTPHAFPNSFVSPTPDRRCWLFEPVFLSRPGIALATAGGVRSSRFRRDPFIRDVASDPGRATVPSIAAPHVFPSAVATASAPATSRISWLNPTPQMITAYASPWSSPSPTQHSLPSGRYPLPGPDFHRLDLASFAWRTATPSRWRTCTPYSLPVSRRTQIKCKLLQICSCPSRS